MSRDRDAVADLIDAVRFVGMEAIRSTVPDQRADVVLIDVHGRSVLVEVKTGPASSPSDLRRALGRWAGQRTGSATVTVFVGDRLADATRDVLREHGWGWLDRRGHLRLSGPGLHVDAAVPAAWSPTRRGGALAGAAGLEVACHLLSEPGRPAKVRALARALNRSPSTVSEIVSALRGQGLLDGDGKAVVPGLFWEVAEHWQPTAVDVARLPPPDDIAILDGLQVGLDDADAPGWALTDTMAAHAYGAPVAAPADYPPDFYVPNGRILDRAVRLLGTAAGHVHRGATIKVAPVPAACERRAEPGSLAAASGARWPAARPLFVALDLARDPGRGREILNGWTPPERGLRVW